MLPASIKKPRANARGSSRLPREAYMADRCPYVALFVSSRPPLTGRWLSVDATFVEVIAYVRDYYPHFDRVLFMHHSHGLGEQPNGLDVPDELRERLQLRLRFALAGRSRRA